METVTTTQIGIFIGCIIVLAGLALVLKQLFQLDPPLHKEYVSRAEHEALEEKMDIRLTAISKSGTESREKMHKEIESLKVGVEVVKAQNSQQSAALGEIRKDQQIIKSEIKADNTSMHTRIGEVLTALGEIKGRIASK